MVRPSRCRLDELVVSRGLAASRSLARSLIMAGVVQVDGEVRDKPGVQVGCECEMTLKQRPRFVSRAGDKLAHALDVFAIDVSGVRALDVGASTGGFVDCLLQRDAYQVIALDVGRGQLDARLRVDPRVKVLEKVNARYLRPSQLPYSPDFLTMDVSFISVTKVLPAVISCMAPLFRGLILIKPQFEAGPEQVGRGGIVRDPAVHRAVLDRLARFMITETQVMVLGLTDSGLPGADGNREFFMRLERGGEKGLGLDTLTAAIDGIL